MDIPTEAKIKKIIFEEIEEMTYNLHVDNYNNFSVNGGLVVHNSIKAHMYALEPLSKNKGPAGVLSGTISDQKKALIQAKADERRKFKEILKKRRQAKKEIDKKENMK